MKAAANVAHGRRVEPCCTWHIQESSFGSGLCPSFGHLVRQSLADAPMTIQAMFDSGTADGGDVHLLVRLRWPYGASLAGESED